MIDLETKRILITGGCGFIGSNLANTLDYQGHEVYICDNLFLGSQDNILNDLYYIPVLTYCKIKQYDVVYHLGNYSSAPMYHTDTIDRCQNTITPFISLLGECSQFNIPLIYASSSSLQGPLTYYSSMRECFETLAHTFHNERQHNNIGMRFFSVYGPNEKHKGQYANCITQFLWAMLKNEDIEIYGDGSQTRDFVYVSDVVNALILAMDYDTPGSHVFEVGTGMSYSFNQIFQLLSKLTGYTKDPKYVSNPITNYVQDTLSLTHATTREHLGWLPTVSVHDGIKKIYEFYNGEP